MKIFLCIIILKCYRYSGYFLDPNDLNPHIFMKTEGNIKQVFKIDFLTRYDCAMDGYDGASIPYPVELFVYACNVLKGCEDDYQAKMNNTKVPVIDNMVANDLKNLLESKSVFCNHQRFKIINAVGNYPNNATVVYRSRKFYQKIVTYYEISFLEDMMNLFIAALFRNVDYPLKLPEIYYAFDMSVMHRYCSVKGGVAYRTTCDDNYLGPQCLYACIPDHRRRCDSNLDFLKEDCQEGWATIPVNVTISNNENCQSYFVKNEIVKRCLAIDICRSKIGRTICKDNFTCIPVRNNTSVCVRYIHYYRNPFFPKLLNFTRKNVLDKEAIYIEIDQFVPENVNYSIFKVYWSHSKELSEMTPTKEKRHMKNSELRIDENKLTFFAKFNGFGFDYSIFAVVQMGDSYQDKFRLNFVIIVPPKKISINNFIYVYYDNILDLSVDGWPYNYMYIIVNRTDINATTQLPILIPFRFPAWKPKVFNMLVTLNFNTKDGFNENLTTNSYHSTRGFDTFSWLDSPYILMENDVLHCKYGKRTEGNVMIRQIFGESEMDDIIGSNITIRNYKPGEYIIACILSLTLTSEVFHRYKTFEIHKYPTDLCILPFAPAVGVLIKCLCIVFPPGDDDYTMVLFDLQSQSIITSTQSNFLRIPYIILHNRRYQIRCRYKDVYEGEHIDIIKNVEFDLNDNSEVTAINFNRECMDFGTLPDEYNIKESNTSDIYVFYNQLFYFKQSPQMEYNVFIIIIVIAFNDGVLYIICRCNNNSPQRRLASIYLQTEKVYRNNFMRRINNKITNISTREIEASKELFESFRENHRSIDRVSTNDSIENYGKPTGTFKVYLNTLEHY